MPNSFGNNFPFGSSRDPLNGFGNFASSYEEMQDRLKEEFRQSQRQENERLESAAAAMLRQQQRAEDLAVFNLEEGTPREEIKKATDNVTRQYHPDKFSDNFKPEQKEGESDEEYGKRVEEKRVECEEHSKKIIAARGRLLA
jgi:DnaJ-domain-containing protein 1